MRGKLTYEAKIAYPTIVLFSIAWLVLLLSTFLGLMAWLHPVWVIMLNTLMAYILFTPMHEAGHLNVSGGKKNLLWLDELVGWMAGIPLLAPFYIFKVIHFRHHAFTNDPSKDPDHWLASKNLFSLFFHAATIFPLYMVRGFQLYADKRTASTVKRELSYGFIGFGLMLLLIVAGGLYFGWLELLIYWIVPAVLAQVFLAFAFDWLPHHPHLEEDKYKNTRVFDIPGLSVLLLAQNYHLIHHLQPRIPFYDYKKHYIKLKGELKEEGVKIIE